MTLGNSVFQMRIIESTQHIIKHIKKSRNENHHCTINEKTQHHFMKEVPCFLSDLRVGLQNFTINKNLMVNAKLYLLSVWNDTVPFDPKTMKHEGIRPPNMGYKCYNSNDGFICRKVPQHSAGKFQSILSYLEPCTTTKKWTL